MIFSDAQILDYLDAGNSLNQSHACEMLMAGEYPIGKLREFVSELMQDDLCKGLSLPANAELRNSESPGK